jgi:hypothetical protein
MKILLKIEEVAFFGASIFLFSRLNYAWWWFPLLLFAPDIGMTGYLLNTRIGAVVYNIFHHRALSVSLCVTGVILGNSTVQLVGILLFAHSTLDRIFNYGLKYPDAFKHTHLQPDV